MGVVIPPGLPRIGSSTDSNVPQWDGTSGDKLKDGLTVGTSANNLVQLDGTGKLPAVDGSQLTNLPASGQTPYDCIVASSGGDYTTVGAAVAAGKKIIFVKPGSYTESGTITLAADSMIIGSGRDVTTLSGGAIVTGNNCVVMDVTITQSAAACTLTVNGTPCTVVRSEITNTNATGSAICLPSTACQLRVQGCELTSDPNSNSSYAILYNGSNVAHEVIVSESKLVLTGNGQFIGMQTNSGIVYVTDCILDEGAFSGTVNNNSIGNTNWFFKNCYCPTEVQVYPGTSQNHYTGCTNLLIRWNNGSSPDCEIYASCCSNLNIRLDNAFARCCLSSCEGVGMNISAVAGKFTAAACTFTAFDGDFTEMAQFSSCYFTPSITENSGLACFSSCEFADAVTMSAGANHYRFVNCGFIGGLTIASNYCIVNGCRSGVTGGGGALTITVSAGATNTLITGCLTDAAISDSGTGTIITGCTTY